MASLFSTAIRTDFLLLAMYQGRACIPADVVAHDFFGLSKEQFLRKVDGGEINLPVIRIEPSAKAARLVHVNDLAKYLDSQWEAAEAVIARAVSARPQSDT